MVSYRDLGNRAVVETLYRDLARRPLDGDLARMPFEENRDLTQRSFVGSSGRDLTLSSLTENFFEISYRQLV